MDTAEFTFVAVVTLVTPAIIKAGFVDVDVDADAEDDNGIETDSPPYFDNSFACALMLDDGNVEDDGDNGEEEDDDSVGSIDDDVTDAEIAVFERFKVEVIDAAFVGAEVTVDDNVTDFPLAPLPTCSPLCVI